MGFNLPISVAVDVECPGHQDDYHWSNGLPFAIEIVVAQKLELFFRHKKLLQRLKKTKTRSHTNKFEYVDHAKIKTKSKLHFVD